MIIHLKKLVKLSEILNDVRMKNINRPVTGQLNINSIRSKFHYLQSE